MNSKRRATSAKMRNATGEQYISKRTRTRSDGTKTAFYVLRLPQNVNPRRKEFHFAPCSPETLREAAEQRDLMLTQLDADLADAKARGHVLYPITISEACEAYLEQYDVQQLATYRDVARVLRAKICPRIGTMLARTVTADDGTELLAHWAKQGLARATVGQIKVYFGALMHYLRKRKQISTAEWVKDVEMPRHFSKAQPPPRVLLTDEEFVQFASCELVDLRLRVLAVMARTLGGMRTSDLHAWTWAHISFEAGTAWVPRPKTARKVRAADKPHELPAVALHFLRLWWMRSGRPEGSVPVFGLIRDHRKKGAVGGRGERITYAASYAKRLRNALKVAGITRRELFESSDVTLRVDFHSFRRAYATALAETDTDARLAMRLSGHKSMATHDLYVMRAGAMRVPDAALPKVPLG
ncbi:MAG: tyrosine-type recombinase/integrase [Polyangiaceae bacterium]